MTLQSSAATSSRKYFNPHASKTRHDNNDTQHIVPDNHFNPHAPMWGMTTIKVGDLEQKIFQSTCPTRGMTQ